MASSLTTNRFKMPRRRRAGSWGIGVDRSHAFAGGLAELGDESAVARPRPGDELGAWQAPPKGLPAPLAMETMGAYAPIVSIGKPRRDDGAPMRADPVDACNNMALRKVRTGKSMARHPG